MSVDWPFIELGELVNEITVGFVGSMTHEYVDDGVPFFRSKNISEYEIDWNDIRYISQHFHRMLKKSALRPGDVVIVRTGKPGTSCVIPDSVDEANCSDIVIVRVNNEKLSAHYLSYFMNSIASHQIKSHLVGAVQQHFNVGSAKKIKIPLPTRHEQEEIVKILKSLDDKRKLNRQINQTLEAMAQAIFKSWFVDFEPVKAKIAAIKAGEDTEGVTRAAMRAISGKTDEELDKMQAEQPDHYAQLKNTAELFPAAMQDSELGEVPEGWKVKPFSEVIDVNPIRKLAKGKIVKKVGMADLNAWQSWIESWQLEEYKSGAKFQNGDTLFARITPSLEHGKTAFVSFLDKDELAFGSTEFIIFAPKIIQSNLYIFHLARNEGVREAAIGAMSGSSGRQRVPDDLFDQLLICVPPQQIIKTFHKAASLIFEEIANNANQNRNLIAIRDALLPKLMSGEIRIRTNNLNTEK